MTTSSIPSTQTLVETHLPEIFIDLNEQVDKLYTHKPIYACSAKGECIIGNWEKRDISITKSSYGYKYMLSQEYQRTISYFGFFVFEDVSDITRKQMASKIYDGYGVNFSIDAENYLLKPVLDGPYLKGNNFCDIPNVRKRGALGMTAYAYNISVRELENQRRKLLEQRATSGSST
jgi:hypothetical protein